MSSIGRRRALRDRSLTQDELAQLRQEAIENLGTDARQTASDIYQGVGNFASFLKENPKSGALLAGMFAPGAATVEAAGQYPDPMKPEVKLPSLAALALPGEEQNLLDAGLLGLGLAGDAVQGITAGIPAVGVAGMLIGGILKAPSKLDDIAGLYKQARELDPLYDKYKAAQEKMEGFKARSATPEQLEAREFINDFEKRAKAGEEDYAFAYSTDKEIKAAEKDLEKQEKLKAEASLDEIPVEALQTASNKSFMIKSGSLAGKLANQDGAFVRVDELPEFSDLFGGVLNTDDILPNSLINREQIPNINVGKAEGIRGRPLVDPDNKVTDIAGPSRAEPVLYYTNTGKVLYNDGLINNVFTDKKTGVVNSSLPASTVAARLVGDGQNPMVRKYAPITKNDAELHGLVPFLEAKGNEPVTIADLRNVYEQNKLEISYRPYEAETMRNRNRSNLGRYGQHFTPRPEDDVAVLNTSRLANGVQPINYRVVDIEEGLVGINRGGLKVDDRNAYHYSGLPEGGNTYDQLGHVRFATIDDLVPVLDQDMDTNRVIQGMTVPVSDNPAVVEAITGKTGRVINEIQFDYRDQINDETSYFKKNQSIANLEEKLSIKQNVAYETFSNLKTQYAELASTVNNNPDLGGLTLNDIVAATLSKVTRKTPERMSEFADNYGDFDFLDKLDLSMDEVVEYRKAYGSDASVFENTLEFMENIAGIRADLNGTSFDLELDELTEYMKDRGLLTNTYDAEGDFVETVLNDRFLQGSETNPLDDGAEYIFSKKAIEDLRDEPIYQEGVFSAFKELSPEAKSELVEDLARTVIASKLRQQGKLTFASGVDDLTPEFDAAVKVIDGVVKDITDLTRQASEQSVDVNNAFSALGNFAATNKKRVLSPVEKTNYLNTGKPFADEYIKQANTRRIIDEFQKADQGSDVRKQIAESVTDPELRELLLVADSSEGNVFEKFGKINNYQQRKTEELNNALNEFEKSDPQNYQLFRDVQNKKKLMPPVFEEEKDYFKFVIHQQVRDAFSRGETFVSVPKAEDIAGHSQRPGVYVEDYRSTYTDAVNEVFDELVAENPDLLVKDELRIVSADTEPVVRPAKMEKTPKQEVKHDGLAQRGLPVPSLILLDDTQQIKSSFRAPFKKGGLVELRKGIGAMARKVL